MTYIYMTDMKVEKKLRAMKTSWGGEKGYMGKYGQDPQYS